MTRLYGNISTLLAQYDLVTVGVDYLHSDLLGSIRTTTDAPGTAVSDAGRQAEQWRRIWLRS